MYYTACSNVLYGTHTCQAFLVHTDRPCSFCTALYCIVLYCAVLYCVLLRCIVLYGTHTYHAFLNYQHAQWHNANKYKHKHTIFGSNCLLLPAIIAAKAFSLMLKDTRGRGERGMGMGGVGCTMGSIGELTTHDVLCCVTKPLVRMARPHVFMCILHCIMAGWW